MVDELQRRETVSTVELAVQLTAAVWFAGSLGHAVYSAGRLGVPEILAVLLAGAIIVGGEHFPVRVTGSQLHAPLAEGAALALATTADFGRNFDAHLAPPLIIVTTAAASALGGWLRSRREHTPFDSYSLAVQVHVVTLASVLFRWIPLGTQTLDSLSVTQGHSPWRAAGLITVVVAVALTVGVLLGAVRLASNQGLNVMRVYRDELEVLWYLHATTCITAVVMALSARALGPWAYPAMIAPLLLVQFAMRRKAAVQQTKRETVRALATLPEVGGYVAAGHVARVAELATGIGRVLKLSERDLLTLEHAARLHDVGQVGLRIPLPGGATVEAAPRDQQAIASNGARILAEAGDGPTVLAIVENQAVSYRRMRELGEDIPLAARILKVANAFDDFAQGRRDARFRETAVERLSLGLGYEYDPHVFEALLTVLGTPAGRPVSGRR